MPNARRQNLVHVWHVGIGIMLGMLIYFLSPFRTRWMAKANAISGGIWALDIPYVHCLREMTVGIETQIIPNVVRKMLLILMKFENLLLLCCHSQFGVIITYS